MLFRAVDHVVDLKRNTDEATGLGTVAAFAPLMPTKKEAIHQCTN